ncbi:efflux RND transporter periplasmic adaptor subunit [Patescibacteria group bacterium]|nr:efflux RND transporter periplasmic adaptor subunit [Patescibacteria group bacterium]MBU1970668.1 efflux RND transporter periplasmic adaptor subunit [Patescibacteria group bacterium]
MVKKFKQKKGLLVAGLLVLAAGYLVFTKAISKGTPAVQYQTALVEKGTLVETVTASGAVSSANNTPVVTQITGKITKLFVQNGDQVKVGQALATIELDQTSNQKYLQQLASYQNAVNSLASAKNSLRQYEVDAKTADDSFLKGAVSKDKHTDSLVYQQLYTAKRVAEERYQIQEKAVESAQLSLNSAAINLQNYSPTIYAPISGVISGLSLQEGSVIPAQAISSSTQTLSQNIAYITTSSQPIVSVNLTEIDIPKVEINAKATLTFDAFPDKTFTGRVFSINTTGTSSSGVTSYPTTIILDTENPKLYANMTANASIIITSKSDILYVPSSAVVQNNGSSAVRKLVNGQLEYVDVTTGISSDAGIEVVSGIDEGDEVVTAVITPTASSASNSSSPFGIRTGGIGGGTFRRN